MTKPVKNDNILPFTVTIRLKEYDTNCLMKIHQKKELTKEETLQELDTRKKEGHHVDERVNEAINAAHKLILLTLVDTESFYSLIWQDIPKTKFLTPPGNPRTLHDVAQRLVGLKTTFNKLCADSSDWFVKCQEIDAKFSYSHLGWVIIVEPNNREKEQTPKGTYYIYDGVHKTLVLAKRLILGETFYRPVETLLILPRPKQ